MEETGVHIVPVVAIRPFAEIEAGLELAGQVGAILEARDRAFVDALFDLGPSKNLSATIEREDPGTSKFLCTGFGS